jgi:hypothetical protein
MEEVKKQNALLKFVKGVVKFCAPAVLFLAGPAIGLTILTPFCDKSNELQNQALEGFENSNEYAQFAELKQSESDAAKAKFNEGALTDRQLAATLQEISSRPYEIAYVYNNSQEYSATLKQSNAYGAAGIILGVGLAIVGPLLTMGGAICVSCIAEEEASKAQTEDIEVIDSDDDKRKANQEKAKDEGLEK